MTTKIRIALITACLIACVGAMAGQAYAQIPTAPTAKNPSPELVGQLTKALSITPEQATGGAGALFGLAKTRLKPDQFSQVSKAVPGMDGLLKAAPKPKPKDTTSAVLGSLGSALPGTAGGIASTAGAFKALGLSPEMATKFIPLLTKFVEIKGGSSVAALLAGALK